eukprot:s5962_g4.t1
MPSASCTMSTTDLSDAVAKKEVFRRAFSEASTEDGMSPSTQDLQNTFEDRVMSNFEEQRSHAEFDIVFIGYGFTSLGIAWALKQKDASLKMAFVSREEKPGGLWWDAADNVKWHIPTYRYALPGLPYDEPECHTDSKHQASSEQIPSTKLPASKCGSMRPRLQIVWSVRTLSGKL